MEYNSRHKGVSSSIVVVDPERVSQHSNEENDGIVVSEIT